MSGCSGCGQCPPCPQQAFVHTLDPDCPVPISGAASFVDVLVLSVTIAAGLPAFGFSVVADLTVDLGLLGMRVNYRLVDVAPDGFTTTVMRLKSIDISAGRDTNLSIIGGLNNLSAGVHSIRLQVDAPSNIDATEAGMLVTVYRQTFFSVTESDCG